MPGMVSPAGERSASDGGDRPPLRVFITVDTEAWPPKGRPVREHIAEAVRRDVFGVTPAGEFGIRRQMDVLDRHGLKAAYFVESLFASAAGIEPLAEVVAAIDSRGHDVQFHLHSEWNGRMETPLVPVPILAEKDRARGDLAGQHLRHYGSEAQTILLAKGLTNLRDAGARSVRAFRAGNFGADLETLRSLAGLGVTYDTSWNAPYVGAACGIDLGRPLFRAERVEGVWEVPITHYATARGIRHAQVNGCSACELRHLLESAWRRGDRSFVIVFHGFELLNARRDGPDTIVFRRFESLCRHLAAERARFVTATFRDLDPASVSGGTAAVPLRGNLLGAAVRIAEQALRRLRA